MALEKMLSYLGQELKCSRIFLFEKDEYGHYDCTMEWCGEGIASIQDVMQDLNAAVCAPYYRYFRKGEDIMVGKWSD